MTYIVSFSSVIQIGDSSIINGLNRALAVQREAEIFYGDEGNLPSYSVMTKPIPFEPITEDISIARHNVSPIIKVKRMHVIAASSSSILHIGSTKHVSMEARIKHIRQLLLEKHEHDLR